MIRYEKSQGKNDTTVLAHQGTSHPNISVTSEPILYVTRSHQVSPSASRTRGRLATLTVPGAGVGPGCAVFDYAAYAVLHPKYHYNVPMQVQAE